MLPQSRTIPNGFAKVRWSHSPALDGLDRLILTLNGYDISALISFGPKTGRDIATLRVKCDTV